MQINTSPAIHEGDCIENEWSRISYEQWCRKKDAPYTVIKGTRIVNLYEVVNSVIEQDLTEAERTAVKLFYFENYSKSQIASHIGTTCPNVHSALIRGEKMLYSVLKPLIDCEVYKKEEETF
mgnify:CR=1 FL=1